VIAASVRLLSRLDDIRRAEDLPAVSHAFDRGIADFGGQGFAIGVIGPGIPIVRQQRGLESWIDYYHESGLYRNCAFTRRTQSSFKPFTWDEEIAETGEATYEVTSAAESYGLRHGLHVPVVTREGFRGGVFVQSERAELTVEQRLALVVLSLAVHGRLEQVQGVNTAAGEALSPREREILLWFAQGKSCEDVAAIVGISPATVMFHYRNVASRYGTLNRTHTVVEAMKRGALELN
jgi:LuxR family quorum sensing-dependent transcriptional regulator